LFRQAVYYESVNYLKLSTYRAGLLQARAYRNLSAFMTVTLAPHGLAITEWAMLGLLKENDSLRPNELSDQLGVKSPLISRHIKLLSDRGWIERIEMEGDARGATIHLTDEGRQTVDSVEGELRGQMRKFLKGISLRQLAAYLAVLEKLAERSV
jgi:DNA-binding MarR family transcriptional regulator